MIQAYQAVLPEMFPGIDSNELVPKRLLCV